MASIYEKPPLALLKKSFDKKNLPKELYKMQNKDPCFDKLKAEIHIDSGRLGIEFTVDKTILDFNKEAEKIHLDWTTSFEEFENLLEGQYKTAWKQVMHDHFPEPVNAAMVLTEHDRSLEENFCRAIELFLKKTLHEEKPQDRQYIYLQPGGDYNVRKALAMKPLDHLHRWEEMLRVVELLPEGDPEKPAASLSVEWFYMTFHRSDRAEYVHSGRKLRKETLKSLAEYFEWIYDSCLSKGLVPRRQLDKIRADTKREMRHELRERYDCKFRHFSEQRRTDRSRSVQRNDGRCRRDLGKRREDKRRQHNGRSKKGPPPHEDKGFKHCHVHGEYAKQSYEECRANLRNRVDKARDNNNNKHARPRHESHYHHDARYASSDDESRGSHHTPIPSDGEVASAMSNGSKSVEENFHIERVSPKKRKLARVAIRSHKGNPTKSSKKASDDQLSWDEVFEDSYLAEFEMASNADLENGIEVEAGVENPFAFGN